MENQVHLIFVYPDYGYDFFATKKEAEKEIKKINSNNTECVAKYIGVEKADDAGFPVDYFINSVKEL